VTFRTRPEPYSFTGCNASNYTNVTINNGDVLPLHFIS